MPEIFGSVMSTPTDWLLDAAEVPLQEAVCPVKTWVVEHPVPSVTVSLTVYLPLRV
jgi:hypothetical protein